MLLSTPDERIIQQSEWGEQSERQNRNHPHKDNPRRTTLKRFFQKNRKFLKPGRRLGMAGWWLFLTSLVLPAVWVSVFSAGWWWGWQCFYVVLTFLLSGMKGVEPPLLFLGYALANVLTLFAPLFLREKSRGPWLLRGLAVFYLLNTVGALYFLLQGMKGLGPGYYAWALSFGLIGVGCAKLSVQPRTQAVPPAAAPPRPKTPAERAAERELLEYLG
jgi:hypothetical protein